MQQSLYQQIIQKHPDSYTAQIVALDAHCSNLHSRLLATLDALDGLQRSHQLDIDALNQRINVLHTRTRVLKSRTKAAEAERDTLKEGVNKLIAKVEYANDHRVLPHSRIYLPNPLEPPTVILEDPPGLIPDSTETLLTSLVSSLTTQLRTARDAFNDLKRVSDARIATLEAQVARRDAEIETYRPCPCSCHPHGLPMASGISNDDNKDAPIRLPASFSKEEALKVLDEIALRQRELRSEVDVLSRKLANAKSSKPDLPQNRVLSTPTILNNRPAPNKETSQVEANVSARASSNLPGLASINSQISKLQRETEELHAERTNIAAVLNKVNGATPCTQGAENNFKGIMLIEEECVRLRKSERALRQQLLLASATEQDLRAQLEILKHQSNSSCEGIRRSNTRQDLSYADGEADMELEEDVADPAFEDNTATARQDDYRPITPLDELPTPSSHPRPSSRLAHIEAELKEARQDVESKERAIDALRDQLTALQELIRIQNSRTSTEISPRTSEGG